MHRIPAAMISRHKAARAIAPVGCTLNFRFMCEVRVIWKFVAEMWRQEGRRVRNRQSYGVVGLLPAEEAAIRKALRESLRTAAAEKTRDDSSSSSSSSSSDSSRSPSPKEQHVGSKRNAEVSSSQSHPPAKRTKLKKQKNQASSSLPTFNGTLCTKSPSELLACQSPVRVSVPSSPVCNHSSPIISDSGSLKLILSSSSDLSSGTPSPSSSHQGSSKSKKKPTKTTSKSSKVKRVLLAEFSTSAGGKVKPLKGKGNKSTPKLKRKNDDKCTGDGAGKIKTGRKKQHRLHQDSKDKAVKVKVQKTAGKKEQKKVSMKVADTSPISNGLSSTLTSVNFPDIPDDEGTAEIVSEDAGSAVRAEVGDSKEEEEEEREDKQQLQKTTTFTCTYSAQRKFASNHTPPARCPEQVLESHLHLKEVPKTEDFITFLCLRGSSSLPEALRKFSQPWTPTLYKRSKTTRVRSADSGKISKSRQCGSAAKKLVYPNSSVISGSKATNHVLQI